LGLFGHGRSKFATLAGFLTNLSNLRIAVVKELHQLESKLVSKYKDLVARILEVYLF
jgi:hypothetical protein